MFCYCNHLLGLEFVVPVLAHSDVVLLNFLGSFWPNFAGYFLAFFLLGLLLNIHNRQFRNLEYANQPLWWINLVFLAFIVLVPFATSIRAKFGDTIVGSVFFDIIMLISGIILYINWYYAKNHRYLLKKDITSSTMKIINYRNLAIPIASLIAIGLAFLNPLLSNFAYLIILVIIFLTNYKY